MPAEAAPCPVTADRSTAFFVVVLVTTFVSTLALRGTGLEWWQRLPVQVAVVAAALWAWSRWPRRR